MMGGHICLNSIKGGLVIAEKSEWLYGEIVGKARAYIYKDRARKPGNVKQVAV